MKKTSIIFHILLFITLFDLYVSQTLCKYQVNKTDTTGSDATKAYLADNSEDKNHNTTCHSLSHTPVNQEKCCYDSENDQCVVFEDSFSANPSKYICPQDTLVHNSCGMAGVYQPLEESVCTEISLVGGYCCYVESKIEGATTTTHSCIRNQKLSKNVNDATDQINAYLKDFGYTFVSMKCQGSYMKNIWMISALIILFLF